MRCWHLVVCSWRWASCPQNVAHGASQWGSSGSSGNHSRALVTSSPQPLPQAFRAPRPLSIRGCVPYTQTATNGALVGAHDNPGRQRPEFFRLPSTKHDIVSLQTGLQDHDDCVHVAGPFPASEPDETTNPHVILVGAAA